MERDLVIKLALDRARANAEGKAFAAAEKARIKELLTDSQVAEKAKEAAIVQSNRARVRAAVEAAAAEKEATKESKGAWSGVAAEIGGAAKMLGSFAIQMLGLDSAKAIVGAILENFQKVKQEAMDAAKFTQGYREALLELAALKGQMGETGRTLGEDVEFRMKTLQTAQAARAFQLSALGAGESAIGVNIARPEFTRAMELAGKFQAIETGDATTHGRLIGMMPTLMGGRGITGEQAFAKEQQLFRIFQPGGGSFAQMTNQFLQQAPLVTSGLFKDPAEMAALLSAFSTMNPEGAGTNVQQFTRGTVGALGRMRGANIEGSVEKQAEFLKRVGATGQMTPVEIGKLISAEFTKEEGEAAKRGEKFNPMTYLQQHGYMNQEDMMALMAFHGLQKSGQFAGTFEPLAAKVPGVGEALAPIEKRMRTDEVFRGRRADIAEELAKIAKGAGREETMQNVFRVAFAGLKAKGAVVGEFEDVMKLRDFDPTEMAFGYRRKVEMESQRMLAEEATRLGIEPGIPEEIRHGMRTGVPAFMGKEKLYGLGRQVLEAGGNIQPGFEGIAAAAEKQIEAAQIFERAAGKIEQALGPKNAPPIQARPVVQTR